MPNRLVVVSKPAAKSRMAVEVISSSVNRSSFSLASHQRAQQVVAGPAAPVVKKAAK